MTETITAKTATSMLQLCEGKSFYYWSVKYAKPKFTVHPVPGQHTTIEEAIEAATKNGFKVERKDAI